MSGSPSSVKQTTARLAPSMRMTADLGDWEHSFLNITTGQSGQILSPHYRDQWNDYYWGRSIRCSSATSRPRARSSSGRDNPRGTMAA